ncbi:MAG: prepilin-type N-terminal cleavage/methylation domain-containing protein [Patescibacteria group bacterium]
MTPHQNKQSGFSLIELLVAASIFAFVVTGVSGLFLQALDMQRRASGIQKIQENALYVLESITREVRVSTITGGDTSCNPVDPQTTNKLVIQHPVNGTVSYEYSRPSATGIITRNGEQITSADVDISSFAFCVSGSGTDGQQTRVTIPITLQTTAGRSVNSVSLQTTIISRDLSVDFSQ